MSTRPPAIDARAIATSMDDTLERATTAVDGALARVDAKAAMLLAFALGLASAVVALAVARPRFHPAALIAAGGAGVMLAVAAVLLLLAVRPHLPRTGATGFVSYARAKNGGDVKRLVTTAGGFDHLHHMSGLAVAKYRIVRRAVDLVIMAVFMLAIAIPAGLIAA
ncbi:Pycsar system effector family protein [Nonomuraea sp. NPDC051941]|uniref:Pycsar system effector family protein n=1 Tax=Nonomuraea sp. NPDC051941 TaxID=3364373 RepID=UPI0037CBF641